MKILCVIDSFGSGGAQRQMANLACGLKAKGHDVEIFVYFPGEVFFRPLIDKAGIRVHEVTKGRGFSFKVLWYLIRVLRSGRFDGVISFLTVPNIYCELAWLGAPRFQLVVSERSSDVADGCPIASKLRRLLHLAATAVVANSKSHSAWLRRLPWLRNKVHTIYNGYSILEKANRQIGDSGGAFQYLVVGRIHSGKNGVRLIEGLVRYSSKHGLSPSVSWAGRRETDSGSLACIAQMEYLLKQHPRVATNWQWLGERDDVPLLLASHDALLHISLYEGLPNVVCEAFIAGCPVIASNVCDHPMLVEEGVRGILCDPLSPESICAAIERFEGLTSAERKQLAENGYQYAKEHLSIKSMVAAYESLLQRY